MITLWYRALRRMLIECTAFFRTMLLRCNYSIALRRIRHGGDPIRVLFLVCETSKWKAQSLYDLMKRSKNYEPQIGILLSDFDNMLSKDELDERIKERVEFFEKKGMDCVLTYDVAHRTPIALCTFKPDIIFYPYPWGLLGYHELMRVSYYALTCYIPYYTQFYFYPPYDCELPFHKDLWCQITQSKFFENAIRRHRDFRHYAGRVVGLGHTGLDYFRRDQHDSCGGKTVIYAPHWSIDHPGNQNFENYSTFLWTGRTILEYAQKHPEIGWIFKPHPTLKTTLLASGAMTASEVSAYWGAWADVSQVCEDGNYQDLFKNSYAMITDCSSFLAEYGATGHALIHLLSPTAKITVTDDCPSKELHDTYYLVKTLPELKQTLQRVIEAGDDYKKEKRLKALARAGLRDNYAAKNIVEYFNSVFGRKED